MWTSLLQDMCWWINQVSIWCPVQQQCACAYIVCVTVWICCWHVCPLCTKVSGTMRTAQAGLLCNILLIHCRSNSTCVREDCGENFEGDKLPNGDTIVSQDWITAWPSYIEKWHNSTHLPCVLLLWCKAWLYFLAPAWAGVSTADEPPSSLSSLLFSTTILTGLWGRR